MADDKNKAQFDSAKALRTGAAVMHIGGVLGAIFVFAIQGVDDPRKLVALVLLAVVGYVWLSRMESNDKEERLWSQPIQRSTPKEFSDFRDDTGRDI